MKKLLNIFLLQLLFLAPTPEQLGAQNQLFSLKECINYAWENSTDIGRANNSIKSETAYLEQSKAARKPNLFFNGSEYISTANNYQATDDSWNRDNNSSLNLSLNSNITLYNGAKLKNTIVQNQTNLAAAEADIQTEKELISLNVLSAYMNVLLAKEQVNNSATQLESTEKQLELADIRKSAGLLSPVDYLNIKSQFAADRASVINAQSELRINFVSLMQIMNMPVDNSFNIKEPDIQALLMNTTEMEANKVYNIALGIQPGIKTAELDLKSAMMGIEIARADALPVLSLNGSLGTGYGNNLSGVYLGEQLFKQIKPAIGLSLTIPIYQRKQVENKVAQATIQSKNYQYNLIDIKNKLRKYIEQACTDAQNANMNYQTMQELYQAENESYRLAEEMFSQGMLNSVDYLTSKNNLVTAENNLTQAKYNVVLQNKVIDYYLGNPISF